MTKSDRQLGMDRDITRRDFIHDTSLAGLGLGLLGGSAARSVLAGDSISYPPTRTGLRGSHPGSFEVAHALARHGATFGPASDTGEIFDLVVVGGGLSGLASAWFYRKTHPEARILILENHDDFGGHARRNEFHQGGVMRLAWGGVFNLVFSEFSDTVRGLMDELGIDLEKMKQQDRFRYSREGRFGPSIWFDHQTYGEDVLVRGLDFSERNIRQLAERVDEFPISAESRESLRWFSLAERDITRGMSAAEIDTLMHGTPYTEFLKTHGGLTSEAAELFVKLSEGFWGVAAHSMSLAEGQWMSFPMSHLLGGLPDRESPGDDPSQTVMFPDGNASVARLLVRAMIPGVATGHNMDDIVGARFDYTRLDQPESKVRLRLNSTAIAVNNVDGGVSVDYVNGGKTLNVRAKHCVLACFHAIIPYLCPQLPDAQKSAQSWMVRRPMLLTNVLLRNSEAAEKLGISGVYFPSRMHAHAWLVRGIHADDYRHDHHANGPVPMMFFGCPEPQNRDINIREQHREAMKAMLALSFEDYEREVRSVLDGLLGPAGFDVKRDVLAITVNRWPHGYAYDYLDLFDPEWPEGQAPHEIARRGFGNVAIANSDSGADAYTHTAIDQAYRAVSELFA